MTPLIWSIVGFLGVSIFFYVLFGGADLGAGMLEPFLPAKMKKNRVVTKAMAPVWEANHVWLILAVVILFMAFPPVYLAITLYLHLPLLLILLGLVARGCAFTFRYYDTLTDHSRFYSAVFRLSSYWTAFFIGLTVGAASFGKIDPSATNYYDLYVRPWLSPDAGLVGVFACCLFSFIASVFLYGEAETAEEKRFFLRSTRRVGIFMLLGGALVFLGPTFFGHRLASDFFSKPWCAVAFGFATLSLFPFAWGLRSDRKNVSRFFGAALIGSVLLGWFALQFPAMIQFADGISVGFAEAAAPPATLRALLYSLFTGSLIIFPALYYLFRSFKW